MIPKMILYAKGLMLNVAPIYAAGIDVIRNGTAILHRKNPARLYDINAIAETTRLSINA
jgi:hypothetical protein